MERKLLLGLFGLIVLITVGCGSDKKDSQNAPPPITETKMTFRQLTNVLSTSCVDCHKPGNAKAGLDLTSYDSVRTKTVAMDFSENNKLWNRVGLKKNMPPVKSAYKIDDAGIETIRKWIEGGLAQ